MKKVKIMLTAITVLAVVGGALAFKAKTFNLGTYCTGTTTDAGKCLNAIQNAKFEGTVSTYFRKVDDVSECANTTCTAFDTITNQ